MVCELHLNKGVIKNCTKNKTALKKNMSYVPIYAYMQKVKYMWEMQM